jgi:hypothetical protein
MTEDTKTMTDEELLAMEDEPIPVWEVNVESIRHLVNAIECLAQADGETDNEEARELCDQASRLIRQAIRAEGV